MRNNDQLAERTAVDVVIRSIDDLQPAGYNPREQLQPGDPEFEQLARSMTELGFAVPVVWNRRTGRVIGGHQRVGVARKLGWREMPVVEVDFDDAREKALNVALNKIEGGWDERKLADLLSELDDGGHDIALAGFVDEQFDDLLRRADQADAGSFLDDLIGDEGFKEHDRHFPEWVPMGYPVTDDQRGVIRGLLEEAAGHYSTPNLGVALVAVADDHIAHHGLELDEDDRAAHDEAMADA